MSDDRHAVTRSEFNKLKEFCNYISQLITSKTRIRELEKQAIANLRIELEALRPSERTSVEQRVALDMMHLCGKDGGIKPLYPGDNVDVLNSVLKGIEGTKANQFREDVWLLVWCLRSGWIKGRDAGIMLLSCAHDKDTFNRIEAACDRLTNWYRDPREKDKSDDINDVLTELQTELKNYYSSRLPGGFNIGEVSLNHLLSSMHNLIESRKRKES